MFNNPFINPFLLTRGPWQALERNVARLMSHGGFEDVRVVGRSGDEGADILASKQGKRWVVQVKFRSSGVVASNVVDEVLHAKSLYNADIPVVSTNVLVNQDVLRRQQALFTHGIHLQIWDKPRLLEMFNNIPLENTVMKIPKKYQELPIQKIVERYQDKSLNGGLVVMATGLGKTYVAAEAVRRLINSRAELRKILVMAHTNELVYQLEKSFWPMLNKNISTAIWNGIEKGDLENSFITFACIDSVYSFLETEEFLPAEYDLIIVDEAHHAGSSTFKKVLTKTNAGKQNGPFLLGLTATPWRSDDQDMQNIFGETICSIDIVEGMGKGYLSNVDYRMHVDNINWDNISKIHETSPKALNKTLFIKEWDDAVIDELQKAWSETEIPRAIVFCSNIEHAVTMRDKINARRFANAGVIYSGAYNGKTMTPRDRSVALCDFADGRMNIMCAVDIFNEGIDVPDVNILVFQRVTHSRRIFVQQLGRGLRISEGKDKVIVLDFVSDIRRFAAGLDLKEQLSKTHKYLELGNPVKFVNKSGEDKKAENFLKIWLGDVSQIQDAGEEDHVLKFPPIELL